MTSPRENLPWLSKLLLASIRKKTSLYSKAKRTNKADLWAKYKLCKRQTQRAIRSARWSFLRNKLSESLEQKNSKPLWRYIKSKRRDGNGVSPLKENVKKQPILLSFYLRRPRIYLNYQDHLLLKCLNSKLPFKV